MNLLETLNRLKALKLNLEVHPDNEPNSEFEGRISDLENAISDIGVLTSYLSSESVYYALRSAYKRPSQSGVDECEDNDYINLYAICKTFQTIE